MKYEGYLTREELLDRVEKHFPFIKKPSVRELYVFDENDVMRKVIEPSLSKYTDAELPYGGIMILYSEFSTISQKAAEWMFPSLLRIVVRGTDRSSCLYWCLPSYFEHMDFRVVDSAYNFSWLSGSQLSVLHRVLEYISEEYGIPTAEAQYRLSALE